jgi:uncharacterized membrane protein
MSRSVLYKAIIYVVVLTLLVLGGTYAMGGFEGLSGHGVGALIAGVAVSFAIGVGLMVLMYASSREHDEAAHRASRDDLDNEPDRKPPEEN